MSDQSQGNSGLTWPRSDLIDLLGITHPIIQAPMASASTPDMAAAVCNVGGLGSLGCAMYDTDGVRGVVADLRRQTDRPFNLNFFVHQEPDLTAADTEPMRALLAPYYAERGVETVPEVSVPFPTFGEAMLETLLDLRPPIVSFHFGLPSNAAVTALKASGVIVMASATTVPEASALADGGVDAIVAQGHEAGGHRGTFAEPFEDGLVGTMALVPQIVDAVEVPVIAAGGIADGRGIAAAFMLGASGAQIGTAYLTCPESSADEIYRAVNIVGRRNLSRGAAPGPRRSDAGDAPVHRAAGAVAAQSPHRQAGRSRKGRRAVSVADQSNRAAEKSRGARQRGGAAIAMVRPSRGAQSDHAGGRVDGNLDQGSTGLSRSPRAWR